MKSVAMKQVSCSWAHGLANTHASVESPEVSLRFSPGAIHLIFPFVATGSLAGLKIAASDRLEIILSLSPQC